MGEIGQTFREAREAKGLSVEQVEADTKIKSHYIEALEAEDFSVFPSVPMARGFIKNYARYLSLDEATLLNLYENIQPTDYQRELKSKKSPLIELSSSSRQKPGFNANVFIWFLVILALLGAALFYAYTQYLEPAEAQWLLDFSPVTYQRGEDVAEPAPATASDQSASLLLPTPTLPPTDTPTPTPTPSPQYYTDVAVELAVAERSWVQVLVDGDKVFEGILEPGDRPNWVGKKTVAIRAGNGGGIQEFVNGQDMGFMGEVGEVVDHVWEKVEELPGIEETPTPDASETPAAN